MSRPTNLPPDLCAGPFTVHRAAELGIDRHVLAGARFRRVIRGVYVLAKIPDSTDLRLRAVRLVVPDAVGSHLTAARIRRLPVPDDDPALHITVARRADLPRLAGVRGHLGPLGADLVRVSGLPTLSVARTFVDLAAARPPLELVDLVIFGDAAVRRGWTKPHVLVERAGAAAGRGVRLARAAAGLVRARVDSPMETRLRLLIVLAGLPEPEVNRPINWGAGWLATPDLSYPRWKIAIEYDGDHHRADRRQWRNDRTGRRLLRDLGWDILECTADDVLRFPTNPLLWLHERLLATGDPAVPAALSDAWRAHLASQRP